ncbi:MAG: hypothetical protein WBC04_24040 [Candidatus Acidiferrales bacterium]
MRFSLSLFQPCERILVVGGNSRKVGKTALLVDILRVFPASGRVAVKISSHSHGECPLNGPSCACGPEEHPFSFREEGDPAGTGDTSRFLAAGAERAILLGVKEGRLARALPALGEMLAGANRVLFESNTISLFLSEACYLAVLDARKLDFKSSLQATLPLVDAFVLRSPLATRHWPRTCVEAVKERPQFLYPGGSPFPVILQSLIRKRFVPV